MSSESEASFADLMRAIEARDEAAEQHLFDRLWAKYEPEIRRDMEYRLRYSAIRQRLDPEDVVQSALKSFFLRAAAGRYHLEDAGEMHRLLSAMVRTKLAEHMRFHLQQRRDPRRTEPVEAAADAAAGDTSPSDAVSDRELAEEFLRRLTPEERELWDLHQQGLPWSEVAALVGGTAQARNKQVARAIRRVRREMGLEQDDS
jgi:RNA polymerase sigma-70 factor (ECF subfamily)